MAIFDESAYTMSTISEVSSPLQSLVREVGAFIREERKNFSLQKVESKGGPNDLVSYVDRTAEERLTAGCQQILPGCGFIREEGGELNPGADYRFIIDPLDGTNNFVHDIPAYCISLAMQYQQETVLGIVYDIPREEFYFAVKGEGATRNGLPIRVSETDTFAKGLFATGFPYVINDRLSDYLAVIHQILMESRGIRRFGAAAIDLAWVACGRIDGYFEMGLNAWDVAAGELLVREAGGVVSDWKGTDDFVFGKQIVATNPGVYPGIMEIIKDTL